MPTDYGLRYCAEGNKPYYQWVPDIREWINVDKADAKDYLQQDKQLSVVTSKTQQYSDVDRAMLETRKYFSVDLANTYAGYLVAGDKKIRNRKILILRDVPLPVEVPGKCDLIDEFIELAFPLPDQADVMHSWLSWAFKSLRKPAGRWDHGQALIFIGDTGAGKTAWQGIITAMLTGRSCDPVLYMMDRTSFNEDTGLNEHWCLSDPRPKNSKDTSFLAELKRAVANVESPFHAKGKTLRTIPTFRRLTVSLNSDNESLQVIQGIAKSEEDKLIALDFHRPGYLEPNQKYKYGEWLDLFIAQIPAYVYRGLNSYVIPSHLTHPRYGVAYSNPTVMPEIAAATAQDRDFQVSDVMFKGFTYAFNGGVVDISNGDIFDKIHCFESPVKERARAYEPELGTPEAITKTLTRWRNKYNGKMPQFEFNTIPHTGRADSYTFVYGPTKNGQNAWSPGQKGSFGGTP